MKNNSVDPSHRRHILHDKEDIDSTDDLEIGDIIEFIYDGELRTVYVLDPDFKDQLHGLTLKYIDRLNLLQTVNKRVDKDTPRSFYNRVLTTKKIVKLDCYRTYETNQISDIHRLQYEF